MSSNLLFLGMSFMSPCQNEKMNLTDCINCLQIMCLQIMLTEHQFTVTSKIFVQRYHLKGSHDAISCFPCL